MFQCSSASRKFLNLVDDQSRRVVPQFQCSSASRKFLNLRTAKSVTRCGSCFSALQRAENSSIVGNLFRLSIVIVFQCSSASRKFLNFYGGYRLAEAHRRFSALQRAENSSIRTSVRLCLAVRIVSVLFSEPKIPQSVDTTVIGVLVYSFQCSSASRKFLNLPQGGRAFVVSVSVLFSEPKIPQ